MSEELNELRVLAAEIGKRDDKSAHAISAEIKRLANGIEVRETALCAENERLRAALEFYADKNHWRCFFDTPGNYDIWLKSDNGYDKARAALAESAQK